MFQVKKQENQADSCVMLPSSIPLPNSHTMAWWTVPYTVPNPLKTASDSLQKGSCNSADDRFPLAFMMEGWKEMLPCYCHSKYNNEAAYLQLAAEARRHQSHLDS